MSSKGPIYTWTRNEIIQHRENLYIPEPGRVKILQNLNHLVTDPPKNRPVSIPLIGKANGGKTRLIREFMRQHPRQETTTNTIIPAISLRCELMTNVQDLSRALLDELGAVAPSKGTHDERMKRFFDLAKRVELKVVFLDEFHDTLKTPKRGEAFLGMLKGLLNQGVEVVPAGVDILETYLQADDQLWKRYHFRKGRLPEMRDLSVVKAVLAVFNQVDGGSISDDLVHYVAQESDYVLGNILDWMQECALSGKPISMKNMQAVRQEVSF